MTLLPLFLASLLLLLPPLASSQNPYCDSAYFWNLDGTSEAGTGSWTSRALTSSFVAGPCMGVSGIGMSETYLKTLIVIDRSAAQNGYMFLPGRPQALAFAQELNLNNGVQRPLDIITNTFCSSGQHGPDGTLLSIAGDWSDDYVSPGQYSIRAFKPCTDGTCGFTIVDNLTHSRWYPTTALLGDGRVLIVGGSSRGVGINTAATNVPFIEYYPKQPGEGFRIQFLEDSLPYNLYPFVHLLPSGRVFLFAGTMWALFNTQTNEVVPGNYPNLQANDANGNQLQFSYPLSATSALFPLTSANRWQAEIMICGGSGEGAAGNADYPASAQCFRIFPEAPQPQWITEEPMSLPRVDATAVLLPDGNLLIVGGTGTGFSALGKATHKPSLRPDMYNTATHQWYAGPTLAVSKVPRTYHFQAALLHDGRVFIAGSNPNSNIVGGGDDFPTEFRSEFFLPPYFQPRLPRPTLLNPPATLAYGSTVSIAFRYTGRPATQLARVKVVLCQPGFSTHGANHGMRNVVLDVAAVRVNRAVHVATVRVPLNRNLIPPTWYWLFVLVDGVPNTDGRHVFVQ